MTEKLVVEIHGRDMLSAQLKGMESSIIRFVGAISSALAAVSVIGFPVIEAAKFQKELLNAAKTTDFTADQTEALRVELVKLSKQIDVTAVDLAKIATMGGQLGIGAGGNVNALVTFSEEIARAVTALDIPAEEAVTAIGKLINIFNVPESQFRNLISALNQVSNVSNATASELFDVVRRIGSLGGSVTFPEAAAISAAMIDLGLTAETAGTTVTKIFADMKSKAGEFASFVGISTEQWSETISKDGLRALDLFLAKLNKMPVAAAAAAKVDLTGGGRIFEAVTKLQEQQLRSARLTAQARELASAAAERDIALAKEGLLVSDEERANTQAKIANLQAQAQSANIITRLQKEAEGAYSSGTSAMREQQVVLGGITRQWQVFQNNVIAASMAVGNVFLPSLTTTMRDIGKDIGDDLSIAQLQKSAQEIVNTLHTITNAISQLGAQLTGLGSTGVDWGAALKVAALVGALAVIKGALFLMGAAFRSVTTAIPGLGALSVALVGITTTAKAQAAAADKAGEATIRVGGIFNTTTKAIEGMIAASTVATSAFHGIEVAMAQSAAASAAYNAALAPVKTSLRSIGALEAEIARLNTRLATTTNAGWATRYARQIAYLEGIRNAAVVAAEGVAIAGHTIDGLQLSVKEAGSVLGVAFAKADAHIINVVSKIKAVSAELLVAAASGQSFAAAMYAARIAAAAAPVVPVGALDTMGPKIATTRLALRNLVFGVNDAIIRILGLGPALASQAGPMTKILIALTTNVERLGVALSKLRSIFMSFVNVIFFAWIVKDMLEMLGLWEPLIRKAREYANLLGLKNLIPKETKDEALSRKVEDNRKLEAAMKDVNAQASKFSDIVKADIDYISNMSNAMEAFTYRVDAPNRAMENIAKSADNILTTMARSEQSTQTRIALEKELNEVVARQEDLALRISQHEEDSAVGRSKDQIKNVNEYATALDNAHLKQERSVSMLETLANGARHMWDSFFGGDLGTQFDNNTAQLQKLQAEWQRLTEVEGGVKTLDAAVQNLGAALFDGADAGTLLMRTLDSADTSKKATSALERYVVSVDELTEAKKELDKAEVELNKNNTSATDAANVASYRQLQSNVQGATENVRSLSKATKEMQDKLRDTGASSAVLDQLFKIIDKAADKKSALKLVEAWSALATAGNKFSGVTLPKIEANDLFSLGAGIIVRQRAKSMYEALAKVAATEAERAKNYATSILGEIQRLAQQTVTVIEKLTKAYADSQRKAKEQKEDKTTDAALRKTLNEINITATAEEARIRDKYALLRSAMEQEAAQLGNINDNNREMKERLLVLAAEENRELFALEEKTKSLRDVEADRVALKKAQREVATDLKQMDELIAKAKTYENAAAAANRTLSDDSSTLAEKSKAIDDRTLAIQKMNTAYGEVVSLSEKIAANPPVEGVLTVKPEELSRIKSAVQTVSDELSKVQVEGSDKIAAVREAQANQFSGLAQGMAVEIDNMRGHFETLAKQSGMTFNEASAKIATMVADSSKLQEIFGKIQTMTQAGLVNFSNVDPAVVNKQMEEFTKQIADKPVKIPAEFSPDFLAKFQEVRSLLGTISEKTSNLAPRVSSIGVDDTAITDMTNYISKNVKPVVKAELEITSVRGADGQLTVTYNPTAKARGGLMGVAAGMSEGLASLFPRFAGGGSPGRVSGQGTGTSDSILSWLSNGEYVIDALTTSAFGEGFFKMLQDLARSGKSLSYLRKVGLPSFAMGGPTSSGFPQPSTSGAVAVNVNINGKKSSLYAERAEAARFIESMKALES